MPDLREHWETIYRTKTADEVSWTQQVPETSLRLIQKCGLSKDASIIDIGGGDSRLIDCLLDEGYSDITLLDISQAAIERAKVRLGRRAESVKWIASDINSFTPDRSYDLWHDRAAFHFLTKSEEIERYVSIVRTAGVKNLIIATFSEQGPPKCSGLATAHYTSESLAAEFASMFRCTETFYEDHTTPFGTVQNFVWCALERDGATSGTTGSP